MALLDDLKIDLGISDDAKDAQLQRLLDKATTKVMNYTNQAEDYVLEHLSEQIIDLATIGHNRKGSEGLTSQSYSGVSEHYVEDIPLPIRRILVEHRRMKR